MIDALVTIILYPIVTIFQSLRFALGVAIVLIPALLKVAKDGKRSLTRFTDLFNFLACFGPLGNYVFSGIAYFFAPYTNSVAPMVKSLQMNDHPEEHLKRFESVIEMKERPWLRNPFKSIHAIALANLGEFSSALVMMSLMQHVKGIKAIPVKLQVEYLMKARGKIRAECSVALEDKDTSGDSIDVTCFMYDKFDNLVCKCITTWTLAEKKGKAPVPAASSRRASINPRRVGSRRASLAAAVKKKD